MAERQISIPEDLYRQIESKISHLEFKSVDDYVIYVLRQLLSEEESQQVFTKEDEEKIQKRLRDLGYID